MNSTPGWQRELMAIVYLFIYIIINGGIYPTKISGTDMKTDERLLHQYHPLVCTKKQTENFLWIKI